MPTPGTSIDRESLRRQVERWTESQRRLAMERVIEQLQDAQLVRVLEGLAALDTARPDSRPSLSERVHAHVEGTRRGEFLGELVVRNAHGQREPWQTAAWVATTWHLLELLLERADPASDEKAVAVLRELLTLAEEVDDRPDELVVFEDSTAWLELGSMLDRARTRVL